MLPCPTKSYFHTSRGKNKGAITKAKHNLRKKIQQCENSAPDIWDPLRVVWSLKDLDSSGQTDSALCSTHSCVRGSGWLHSIAASVVVAVPWSWLLLYAGGVSAARLHLPQWPLLAQGLQPTTASLRDTFHPGIPTATSAAFPNGLSWSLTVPNLTYLTWFLRSDATMSSKPCGRLLHIPKLGC